MLLWAPAILVSKNLKEFWKDSFWDEDLRSRMENFIPDESGDSPFIYFGTIFADLLRFMWFRKSTWRQNWYLDDALGVLFLRKMVRIGKKPSRCLQARIWSRIHMGMFWSLGAIIGMKGLQVWTDKCALIYICRDENNQVWDIVEESC